MHQLLRAMAMCAALGLAAPVQAAVIDQDTLAANVGPGDIIRPGGAGTPDGVLILDGNFSLTGATYEIEVGDVGGTIFSDLVFVLGDADLTNGILRFIFLGGFLPLAGQAFPFLDSPNVIGLSSAVVEFVGIAPGWAHEINNGGDGGVTVFQLVGFNDARALPAPGAALLLGGGLLGFGALRRSLAG